MNEGYYCYYQHRLIGSLKCGSIRFVVSTNVGQSKKEKFFKTKKFYDDF